MRALIVSDIHANLVALEAVLKSAERGGTIDAVWSLGDCVGYGPQPGECIARLKGSGAVMVAGNHERAATGAIGTEDFNRDAAAAAEWTKARLTEDEKSFLDGLPEVDSQDDFTLVHGTLRWPIWEYLYSAEAALAHLALQVTPFGLVGHTHVPMLVGEDPQSPEGCLLYRLDDGETVTLSAERRIVLNPGSVGQPRDGDPRASYALYDSESRLITLHRVEYDIPATQKLMSEAKLPGWLIERLSAGR
ncbi:MAG TPA: metallophosphoesterase family protein [Dehalococcoidia bacterium]|jgi:diadenosine tetraphosphatase ApaH/serine/threonine PP2A family protein phosphatase|nr:metallophosphoesterase family protein [Dehalococcoidia bacterium]